VIRVKSLAQERGRIRRRVGYMDRAEPLCCGAGPALRRQNADEPSLVWARGRYDVLNRSDRSSPMAGEAEVKYLDGDFRVVRPGAFVRCAMTGVPIPLEELKYWSVDLQEAYVSQEAVLQRHFPNTKRAKVDGGR
jgi:hypothetical protein